MKFLFSLICAETRKLWYVPTSSQILDIVVILPLHALLFCKKLFSPPSPNPFWLVTGTSTTCYIKSSWLLGLEWLNPNHLLEFDLSFNLIHNFLWEVMELLTGLGVWVSEPSGLAFIVCHIRSNCRLLFMWEHSPPSNA